MEDEWTAPETQRLPEGPGRRRRGRDLRLVLTGIVLALLVWFAVANFQDVRIQFWMTTATAPLIAVIVISGVLGAAASGLWSWRRRRRTTGANGA